jgi:hypothetical protein
VFDDPFAEGGGETRPVLVVLDDGSDDPVVREQRGRLLTTAAEHGVRVEKVTAGEGSQLARYASLLLSGTYAAAYLQIGLVTE